MLAEEKDFDEAGDYVEKAFVRGAPFVVGSFDAAGHKISSVIGSGWHTVVSDADSAANALKNAGQDVVNQVASWL